MYNATCSGGPRKEIPVENPEATSVAIDKNNWSYADDVAVLNEEAYCHTIDTAKDMIIRQYEDIYPG